ncbi:MAG: 30S ribosomal protein S2 [Patescibacteria group bacterium]|nr:30S ribosomal protein S2 [Patescibacteria group bacterium]
MPKKDNKPSIDVSLEELMEAGCHFGHQARRWHPKMAPYIWGKKDGIHIFDLDKTRQALLESIEIVKKIAAEGKLIIFVGTKKQASQIITEEAIRAGMPFVAKRWLGGTLTNWKQLKLSVNKLIDLKIKREAKELDKYTKKERVLIDKQIDKLEKFVGGLQQLTGLPDAIFVVDIKREDAAVREAHILKIPVIAIVDSNCDPEMITTVIPGNDDAIQTIRLITSKIVDAVLEGKSIRQNAESPAEQDLALRDKEK